MAEIKVQLKGDDTDVKNKFREAGNAAREFRDHVKEQFAELKDAAADIAGETGFGGIKKVLGGLGTVAFGAAIVEGFKKATEAAIDFQKTVLSLKIALGPAQAGLAEDLAHWVESVSGGMGTKEENAAIMARLVKITDPESAKKTLIDIQNAALRLGVPTGELGEEFTGMALEGKVQPRFFRTFPELAKLARDQLGMTGWQDVQQAIRGKRPTDEEVEEEMKTRIEARGGVDWLFKQFLPAIAPGGMQYPGRLEAQKTLGFQVAELNEKFEQLYATVGEELLPVLTEWVNDIKTHLPALTESAKELGKSLADLAEWVRQHFGWLGEDISHNRYPGQRTVEAIHQGLFSTKPPDMEMHNKLFGDTATSLHRAAQHIEDSAEKQNRMLNPK
jgi:hypothetical protein